MAAPKAADIAVHSPRSPEERNRIYAFRYRIEIIKKGGVSVFADDKNKIVKDPFGDAACQLCLVRRHSVSASV